MERILVVEDEPKLNDIVRDYLVSLGFGVDQCLNGPDGVAKAAAGAYDLMVLDLMLPGLDGIEVARRVRSGSALPIIMLTARDSEADKILGLEIGADDYLTKPFSVRELGARVRAVLRRYAAAAPGAAGEILTVGKVTMDGEKRTVVKDGRAIDLTQAQFDLLRVLLKSPGRVFTRGDIIRGISGYEYEGYERTVDVHVKNIRKAIEDDPSNPTLIVTVWGVGYKAQE